MTGRIQRLSTARMSGVILAADNRSVGYEAAAVLAPGFAALVVGQIVEFDLLEGKWPKAVNVRAELDLPAPRGAYLQYLGFEQDGSVRAYRFRKVVARQPVREITVNADMALFSKHHVAIQDGPALSASLLSADAQTWPESQWLSEDDLTRHGTKRGSDGAGPKRRRLAG